MYILPIYVAKDFWSSKIMDQFWKILWMFKVLQFYIYGMNFFLMWLIGIYPFNFFPIKCVLLYESFW
jgi:hypothetical protein